LSKKEKAREKPRHQTESWNYHISHNSYVELPRDAFGSARLVSTLFYGLLGIYRSKEGELTLFKFTYDYIVDIVVYFARYAMNNGDQIDLSLSINCFYGKDIYSFILRGS
jgi:hypothetical protein